MKFRLQSHISFFFILLLMPTMGMSQQGTLSLPPIFDSRMILQQEDSVVIWGSSDYGEIVIIETGWDNGIYQTTPSVDKKWSVKVATPKASFTPYQMVIRNSDASIILDDILIGDVWFVSGQSNMYESFRGFINQPVNRAQEILLESSNITGIRLFKVKESSSLVERDSIDGSWQYAKPGNIIDFSAVGYVFGKTVYDYVNIPIGLVQCAQSGTKAEAWLDKQALVEFGGFDLENIVIEEGLGKSKPMLQYNSMLYPLLPLRIKGVVWYQGEGNVGTWKTYEELFSFLINKWRDYFDDPDLPFYYVQIAPFSYDFAPGLESQYLREAQLNTMKKVTNVGMVVTLDIGSKDKIHPPEKETVGKRLAYWALNKTYGVSSIACRGPEFKSLNVVEGKANLKFDFVPGGLSTFGKELNGFEVAGKDRKFYSAEAEIGTEHGTWEPMISVWSDQVEDPVAVRYGFTNYVNGTLYNIQGLPASSFRTDDW